MCFVEFIGYVCGHRSQPVLRPCPLTTNHASNPVCPNPAERPQLLDANCPACARILHGRWVEIVTIEHQYMHERGACGCGVQFPADKFPPLMTTASQSSPIMAMTPSVSQESSGESVRPNTSSSSSSAVSSTEHHQHRRSGDSTPNNNSDAQHQMDHKNQKKNGKYKQSGQYTTTQQRRQKKKKADKRQQHQNRSKGSRGRQNDETTTEPDRNSEQNSTLADHDKPPALSWNPSVLNGIDESIPSHELPRWQHRIQSQYGAEWLAEHQALHASGQCKCPVQFQSYKPMCALTEDDVAAAEAEHGDPFATNWRNGTNKKPTPKQKKQKKMFNDIVQPRNIPEYSDLLVWQMNHGVPKSQQVHERRTMKFCGFANLAQAEHWWYNRREPQSEQQQNEQIYAYSGSYSIAGPKPQRTYPIMAYSSPQTQAAHEEIKARTPSRKAKAYRGLDATAPPFVSMSEADNKNQTTKYTQDHGLPLAGLPIGVGPEGLDEYSHSAEWEMCNSARPKRIRTQSCPPSANQ
ncbi:hypothetical protein PFICI_01105 [Pestalotiopsis fici W106-1]|uniref:Uncharacterized protein n=1 Tax=Pestalotiopsis fici (strain W106-1 / CGMCC3.15140) TaxID=1229662 RepID=W3XP43_PESFW|nr:uncharacterized protein PFICI_01105 [Pestalotiopsis fici W106-1]ETS87277.1 hypothetical protein PFICI_01105 [Pestalotiopsis fici W106-1]